MNIQFLNSEVNLIRRLRKNDQEAFELIFNKYREKLYYFTYGYLHSSVDSEEILQNVFISLWENRLTLRDEPSLKNYLYKITINLIYNHFKHLAVRQKYHEHISTQNLLEDDHSEQEILYNDLRNTIENIIKDLPAKQQMIFRLSRQDGLSHNDIADQLGLSVRSVENQIYRALKYIKEKLSRERLLTE